LNLAVEEKEEKRMELKKTSLLKVASKWGGGMASISLPERKSGLSGQNLSAKKDKPKKQVRTARREWKPQYLGNRCKTEREERTEGVRSAKEEFLIRVWGNQRSWQEKTVLVAGKKRAIDVGELSLFGASFV